MITLINERKNVFFYRANIEKYCLSRTHFGHKKVKFDIK